MTDVVDPAITKKITAMKEAAFLALSEGRLLNKLSDVPEESDLTLVDLIPEGQEDAAIMGMYLAANYKLEFLESNQVKPGIRAAALPTEHFDVFLREARKHKYKTAAVQAELNKEISYEKDLKADGYTKIIVQEGVENSSDILRGLLKIAGKSLDEVEEMVPEGTDRLSLPTSAVTDIKSSVTMLVRAKKITDGVPPVTQNLLPPPEIMAVPNTKSAPVLPPAAEEEAALVKLDDGHDNEPVQEVTPVAAIEFEAPAVVTAREAVGLPKQAVPAPAMTITVVGVPADKAPASATPSKPQPPKPAAPTRLPVPSGVQAPKAKPVQPPSHSVTRPVAGFPTAAPSSTATRPAKPTFTRPGAPGTGRAGS